MGAQANASPSSKSLKLVKPRTKQGKRVLEKREPKLIEDAKRILFLYGGKTSQLIKDVSTDLHRLKKSESTKQTRHNEDVRPFEAGGETSLEFYSDRADCSMFVLGTHSKKRPHNLTVGRLFKYRLYDALELGVDGYVPMTKFGSAATSGLGNKPEMVFCGEKFESNPEMRLAKSLFMDMFRGEQVDAVNLKGLDRVMVFVALNDTTVLLRQYQIQYKKSGTKIPRTELREMGPRITMQVRRSRHAPTDLEREAMKQPKLRRKKEKNVTTDMLQGKIGRIYMPRQDVDTIALHKPKGAKRARQEAAVEAKEQRKKTRAAASDDAAASE